MMRILLPFLVALGVAPLVPLRAGEAPPAAAELPQAIGGEVVAVLRVDDAGWLGEQLNAALGGNGPLAAGARSMMAELLFGVRTMASIDESRPALIAWRTGDAPLVCVVPFHDRQRFLEEFGSLRQVDRLLIRTGEREGTVVYNQVTPRGTWEYRLMLRDGYAYLARSKEECELLAEHPLRIDTEAPPLRIEYRGSFLAEGLAIEVDDLEWDVEEGAQALVGPLAAAVTSSWRSLLEQIALLQLRVEEADGGQVGLRLAAAARADSPLATWIARQSNAGSRLLPLVTRPGDLVTAHGSLRWQGELERLGRTLAKQLAAGLGRQAFSEQMDADLRSYFSLLDRQGAFAFAIGLTDIGEDRGPVVRAISEQPGAADLITLERGLDSLFIEEGDEVGEFDAVGGLLSYRKVQRPDVGDPRYTIAAAARDHLLKVASTDPQVALVELRTLIASLGETHAPQGSAGVFALRLHLDAMLAEVARAANNTEVRFDPMAIDLACRVDAGRRLELDLDLPLAQIQEAVVRSGLMPDPIDRSAQPTRSSRSRR